MRHENNDAEPREIPLDPYSYTTKWYEEHPEALRYEVEWLLRRPEESWIGKFDIPG